jgi:REP element-mobilizing transposase RayT
MLDTNIFPLAYLITFRTYGTWLHGDERGSVDRQHNVYGTPRLPANLSRKRFEEAQAKTPPIILDPIQRVMVEKAVREVCTHREYSLLAVNARSNHVHAVISAACKPEPILEALKAYCTRKLRRAGLILSTTKPWVRHGSTRYLWKERQVELAMNYVLFGQGDDPPDFRQ